MKFSIQFLFRFPPKKSLELIHLIKIVWLLSVRVIFDGMQWSQKLYREWHSIIKKFPDKISFPLPSKEITRTDILDTTLSVRVNFLKSNERKFLSRTRFSTKKSLELTYLIKFLSERSIFHH
jgi:hypothetical protein